MGFDPNDDITAASLNSALDEVAALVNTVPASGVRPQCFGPQHFDVGVVDPGDWTGSPSDGPLTITSIGSYEYTAQYTSYGGSGFEVIRAVRPGTTTRPLQFLSRGIRTTNLGILVLLNVEYWSFVRGNDPAPNVVTAIQVRGSGSSWRTIARSERWAYPLRIPDSFVLMSDTDTPQLDIPTRVLIDRDTVVRVIGQADLTGIRAVCAMDGDPALGTSFTLGNCRMSILPFRV